MASKKKSSFLDGAVGLLGKTELIAALLVVNLVLNGLVLTELQAFSPGEATGAQQQVQAQPTQQPTQQQTAPTATISTEGDPVEGSVNAPVTIIEFSDFQCPYCERFFSQTLSQIRTNYIDTGKVRLVYKNFPLSFHASAMPAAIAADCADAQGKFWEYHDKLFNSVSDWTSRGRTAFEEYAQQLGLNAATFSSCLDSSATAYDVQADIAAGSAAGVSGTPSFFINGVKVVGAQPYSVFQQAIEQMLAG